MGYFCRTAFGDDNDDAILYYYFPKQMCHLSPIRVRAWNGGHEIELAGLSSLNEPTHIPVIVCLTIDVIVPLRFSLCQISIKQQRQSRLSVPINKLCDITHAFAP